MPSAREQGHRHGEAFSLMLYQGQKSKRVLDVWNSRDGVTPFMAVIDDEEYMHIAFSFDRYAPHHRPRPGDYFWRDITKAEAQRIAAMRVDHFTPELSEREREEAIADIWPSFFENGGSPQPYIERVPFIQVVDNGGL